jgi:hypothetical protein
VLGWEPSISLEDGLNVTYHWIESQLIAADRIRGRESLAAAQDH